VPWTGGGLIFVPITQPDSAVSYRDVRRPKRSKWWPLKMRSCLY